MIMFGNQMSQAADATMKYKILYITKMYNYVLCVNVCSFWWIDNCRTGVFASIIVDCLFLENLTI